MTITQWPTFLHLWSNVCSTWCCMSTASHVKQKLLPDVVWLITFQVKSSHPDAPVRIAAHNGTCQATVACLQHHYHTSEHHDIRQQSQQQPAAWFGPVCALEQGAANSLLAVGAWHIEHHAIQTQQCSRDKVDQQSENCNFFQMSHQGMRRYGMQVGKNKGEKGYVVRRSIKESLG